MSKTYTVREITAYIKNMFTADYLLGHVTVKGEISNYKDHPSGHIYFTLKDESAAISVVMYAGSRGRGLLVRPRDGMQVSVSGSVTVYENAGRYQLIAKEIRDEGEGALFLKFQALKKELEEMGMFDASYKKPIPKYAMRIGIVTSSSGAALHDIMQITERRNPYVQLILAPAKVQGEGAGRSIAEAIRKMDELRPDVMIVGRGGGSYEDLFCFNDEEVARAIFDCDTPVISAVGHEVDFTIADYVSDLRAPTPSAAAELAVFDVREYLNLLDTGLSSMEDSVRLRIERLSNRIGTLALTLERNHPKNRLEKQQMRLMDMSTKLYDRMSGKLSDRMHRFENLSGKLEALSPLKKLTGGYGFIEKDGTAVKDINDVDPGDRILVKMEKGTVSAEVTEVKKY